MNTRRFILIGVMVSLIAMLVGSVQFARYDWTGVRLQRAPDSLDRTISADCHEEIRPFTTSSGRVIAPAAIDDQQYLSMIERFRGETEFQVECFYTPFTDRAALLWLSAQLPFEDALSLGLTNMAFTLLGIWLVLATLVVQGFGARVVATVGVLISANWLVFVFGGSLLVEPAPFAFIAACWLLMALRRWWWIVPVLAVGVLLKETAVLALPPLWVATASMRRGPLVRRVLPAVAATLAAAVAYVGRSEFGPAADAEWPTGINLELLPSNLTPIDLALLAVALGPLLVPAALWFREQVGQVGWRSALWDPAVVGVLAGIALLGWIAITADLSPRFFWPCFPFAATLAARWLSRGRPAAALERWPNRRALGKEPAEVEAPTASP